MLIILFVPYATNQEQSAIILLGSLLFLYIYCLKQEKYNKKLINIIFISIFVYSLSWFMIFFFCPGHIERIGIIDSPFRIPDFVSWSILKKLYHGFSTTFSVIIFEPKVLVIIFLLLLGIVFYVYNKQVFGFIPLLLIVFINLLGKNNFIYYYDYSFGMPDFCLAGSYKWVLVIITSLLLIASIILLIFKLKCSLNSKYSFIVLLCFAFGSRIMMGFSSTLYGSSFRTFSFLYFILIIINILLFDLLMNFIQKDK